MLSAVTIPGKVLAKIRTGGLILTALLIALPRFLIGVLFLYSGLSKVVRWDAFYLIVRKFMMVPRRLASLISALLPILETSAAICILLHLGVSMAASLLLLLLMLFSMAIATNLLAGKADITCGCFGLNDTSTLSWWLLVRNMGFMLLVMGVLSEERLRYTLRLPGQPVHGFSFDAFSFLIAVGVVLLYELILSAMYVHSKVLSTA